MESTGIIRTSGAYPTAPICGFIPPFRCTSWEKASQHGLEETKDRSDTARQYAILAHSELGD